MSARRVVRLAVLAALLLFSRVESSHAGHNAAAAPEMSDGPANRTSASTVALANDTTLGAETPLPTDAVRLEDVPSPPEAGEAEAMLVQGGPTPRLRYYALDALGSVRVTFDAAGTVIGRADYEPFGAAVTASTTGSQPRQQLTGQERDGEVGVDYFGARLYVPQMGRMPSVDPLYAGAVPEPQRWSRYAYALNTPINAVDPDGRSVRTCAGKSNGKVDDCNTGGASGGTEPALSIGHSEHSSDLFLLMQYGDFGYGAGGGGGGGVNMSEWDSVLQRPRAQATVIAGAIQVTREDGTTETVQLISETAKFDLPYTPPIVGPLASVVRKVGGENAAARVGRLAHTMYKLAVGAKDGWKAEVRLVGASGNSYRVDILTPRGYVLELKPRTASGIAKGASQAALYAAELERKVRVIYYDPSLWIP